MKIPRNVGVARPRFAARGAGTPLAGPPTGPTGSGPIFQPRRREPRISTRELEEAIVQHEQGGRGFRFMFFLGLMGLIALLVFAKWDTENNVTGALLLENGPAHGAAEDDAEEVADPMAKKYYDMLKVTEEKRARGKDGEDDDDKPLTKEEEAKERRRVKHRMRKQAESKYQDHLKEFGQMVHCGRSCDQKHKQLELAHEYISTEVDRDLYKVMGVDKKGSSLSPNDLKKKYSEMKEKVEKEETNEEDKEIALEELKNAVDVLSNADSRTFYNLYGRMPPALMKKVSTKHGGWGQELMLRTFKNRIFMEWLNYFDSYWVDVIGVALIFFFGYCLVGVSQFDKIWEKAKEIEAHYELMAEMAEKEKERAQR